MEIIIRDYSIESAFNRIPSELESLGEECPLIKNGFINVTDNTGVADIDVFKGTNVIFGTELSKPGENTNETQTRVENTPTKGSKNWETKYLGVFDSPLSLNLVPGSITTMKEECVQACKEATKNTMRNTYVIIGKSAIEFNRCQAEVQYKPSAGQTPGVYKFVW